MGNRTIHRCNLTIIASVPDIDPRRIRKRPDDQQIPSYDASR